MPAWKKEIMEEKTIMRDLQSEIQRLASSNKTLKESNEELRHLLYMVADGLMMINKEGWITFVNQALKKMIGSESRDMIGSRYDDPRWNLIDHDAPPAAQEPVFQKVFETGRGWVDHMCRLQDTERVFLVNTTVHHDDQGRMAGIAAAVRDCSELYRVRAENREMKSVYDRFTHYADEAIFRIEAASGRIVYINEAARTILGYTLDDYASDSRVRMKVISDDQLRTWLSDAGQSVGGKNVLRNIDVACTGSEGQTILLEFTVIAVRNDAGAIQYLECIGRDITVRRFMEAELAKAQKLESIGLLAGGIAHDFNNIMTAVFGSLALAKMESIPESPVYMRLVAAEEQCMKARALTRKLLNYSRGGSPQRKTASIAGVIGDAVQFSLSGKNIDCRFDFPDGLWSAQIDEGQMHQVVHSLVSNAAEAMPQGGRIEIGARNVDLIENQVIPLKAGRYIQWYVRDHGVGISQEHMKKIFDPYFTTKQMSSVKGMGLGLAICYSIVKSHDGMITVESTPGAGTVFTVYIPASNGEKDDKKPAAAQEKPADVKKNILLIDDEKILLDVTGSMLKHIGYNVVTASTHSEAMERYRQGEEDGNPFALIIMDLTMRGDEAGEMAIRRWKDQFPEVKAVISSGYMNDPVIEEYWKYGFVGAMVKPYSLTDLKDSLEKILAGKGRENH